MVDETQSEDLLEVVSYYTDNVPSILLIWIIVTGRENRNIHIGRFAISNCIMYSHCLLNIEEAYTTMIIIHSTGEEIVVLCTSTIIFSYLVNYIESIHVTSEIMDNGTL